MTSLSKAPKCSTIGSLCNKDSTKKSEIWHTYSGKLHQQNETTPDSICENLVFVAFFSLLLHSAFCRFAINFCFYEKAFLELIKLTKLFLCDEKMISSFTRIRNLFEFQKTVTLSYTKAT
jgi:hypothetical protein